MGFSRIVGGLTGMLTGGTQGKFKGVPFDLTLEARTSFCNLQKAFTTPTNLQHLDPFYPFEWKRMLQALLSLLFSHKLIPRLEIDTK